MLVILTCFVCLYMCHETTLRQSHSRIHRYRKDTALPHLFPPCLQAVCPYLAISGGASSWHCW